MNKICGNCKYLGHAIGTTDGVGMEEIKAGFWERKTTFFACDLIKHDKEEKYQPRQGAVVIDGSGYMAALCVEEDFGCNRWEAK